MLNSMTKDILDSLSSISPTCIVEYPVTGVQDIDKSIVAFIDLNEIGESEFETFGLMNISEFLSTISLVENADINIKNKLATIKNSSGDMIKYYTVDTDIIKDAYGANPAILTNIDKGIEACKFKLSKAEFDKIKKKASIMKLNDIQLNVENGELIVTVTDTSRTGSNSSKSIIHNAEINDNDMSIVLDVNNIKRIPTGNYTIKVAKNPKTGSYITRWDSDDITALKIVVTVVIR